MESDRQIAELERYVAAAGRSCYGEQWGTPEGDLLLREVRDGWLSPMLAPDRTILEIGSGGGRWSQYFRGRVKRAILVDGTPASEQAVSRFCPWSGFRFVVSTDGRIPDVPARSVDYVWSYDTFVHFHPALFDFYVAEVGRVLAKTGVCHLHYATLWPDWHNVNGRCFKYRDPEDVEPILQAAGLCVTGRRLEIRAGYGSILVELSKEGRLK
jgi:SAM-dependent methyltransferase